ncbi:protein-glutamate methylesterase/protein-glutamine glutaminase [Clostridium uliginosum]|uniref:Protein-glutamate methylesterase/protein-glutamine glutaminase n=1 Tax=Clostridium uliginosum TaxID=119641 RepID=A0A1I1N835_9CLOT|nr:chemotaxis response regulator protein-glutamate methylesterase [Clostridium uliginosum]SFC91638.1 two-component system, chemotaxis family, response regulator CheB [Clostridium uliginosum]
MSISKKIRVLVVDDSLVFREVISKGLQSDGRIQIVATASDPFIARDKIIEFEPDVMVLDVELPRMNGIEFLKRLMPQYPIPVVVISSANKNIFEALNAGAIDFVMKPEMNNINGLEAMLNELIIKVKIASIAKVENLKNNCNSKIIDSNIDSTYNNKVILIGSSTGGTQAVYEILKKFPSNMPPILIAQHMPAKFTKLYAERLNNSSLMEVREAKDGDKLYPGLVLVAPGDYHMRLKSRGNEFYVQCFKGEKVNGHCPSVDVLFDSGAKLLNKNAIGVILTGMGYDGAKGLLNMRKNGARTIGQDEQSCVVYGMPKVAFEIGAVEKKVSLDNIPRTIGLILKTQI